MRVLTEAKAKAIVATKSALSDHQVGWVERWIEQLVRENSYPPQLASRDFLGKLGDFFAPADACAILDRIRNDFRRTYPQTENKPDFSFLGNE